MDNNPQWKFIETLNYGSYNVKVYSDEQQGLILYQYFTRDSGFCDYSYTDYLTGLSILSSVFLIYWLIS